MVRATVYMAFIMYDVCTIPLLPYRPSHTCITRTNTFCALTPRWLRHVCSSSPLPLAVGSRGRSTTRPSGCGRHGRAPEQFHPPRYGPHRAEAGITFPQLPIHLVFYVFQTGMWRAFLQESTSEQGQGPGQRGAVTEMLTGDMDDGDEGNGSDVGEREGVGREPAEGTPYSRRAGEDVEKRFHGKRQVCLRGHQSDVGILRVRCSPPRPTS